MSEEKTVVAIVDDCTMYSKSLFLPLRRLPKADVHLFTTKAAGHDMLEWVGNQSRVDIVVLDLLINGINGVEIAKAIRGEHPECDVIILTGCDEDNIVYRKALALIEQESDPEKIVLVNKTGKLATKVVPQSYVANRVSKKISEKALR